MIQKARKATTQLAFYNGIDSNRMNRIRLSPDHHKMNLEAFPRPQSLAHRPVNPLSLSYDILIELDIR